MRVLLSAFSCEPGKGSEPEVGFRALLAAAQDHEVWALVSCTGLTALERTLRTHPLRSRITLVPIPVGVDEGRLGLVDFHRRYDRWQRKVGPVARDLDRRIDFDLVHHVTLATVWTRVGVAVVPKPLVWGPVGGGVDPPLGLIPELGWRGVAEEAARLVARRSLARLPQVRRAARTAVVTLAQNRPTARKLRAAGSVVMLTNAAAIDVGHVRACGPRTRDIAFVGRLVPWKGAHLAVRALRDVRDADAVLRFYGSGPERGRLERAARRWGLEDRVHFEGWVSRDELLRRLAVAGALLHPSLHDDSGLSVAEALALGTPVVCLDHGGPAEVVRLWDGRLGRGVTPGSPAVTARRLAAALDEALDDPPPVPAAPSPPRTTFDEAIPLAYEAAARATPLPRQAPE